MNSDCPSSMPERHRFEDQEVGNAAHRELLRSEAIVEHVDREGVERVTLVGRAPRLADLDEGDPPMSGTPSKRPAEPGMLEADGSTSDASNSAAVALPMMIPEPASGGVLVVPSLMELEAAVSRADTLEAMLGLDKALALLKEAADQFRATIDEAARIATSALITKRRIGTVLLQVDRRGGDRAKWHDATLLERLLRELGKDKAKRYRQIARMPEGHFQGYLAATAEEHVVPTEAGAAKHSRQVAGTKRTRRPRRPARCTGVPVLSREVLDAVERILGEIDVCVGKADVACGQKLENRT